MVTETLGHTFQVTFKPHLFPGAHVSELFKSNRCILTGFHSPCSPLCISTLKYKMENTVNPVESHQILLHVLLWKPFLYWLTLMILTGIPAVAQHGAAHFSLGILLHAQEFEMWENSASHRLGNTPLGVEWLSRTPEHHSLIVCLVAPGNHLALPATLGFFFYFRFIYVTACRVSFECVSFHLA